ncbi:hypothetical protein ACERK3_09850 [Phycisphaerales bacterium AB-hyl4]|uniref:ABC-2 type transport system permease protein n=1 Tax=Natronomicrosphaera hydrolytica TaxID=3242702 RepID=A0ABV4U8J1_9BACT
MTAIHAIAHWFDDRLNPVLVKELRQAVRSWFVIIVLMLFLLLMLVTLTIYLLATDDLGGSFDDGQPIFMILQGMLLGTCLLFVPIYVGVRLAAERADQNVDLLYITTLRPMSIAWGKVVCGLTITLLIYSVCAPFLMLTYLLRGIDLPTIFLALGINLLPMLAVLSLAILIAALPVSVVMKVILAVLLAVGTVSVYTITMTMVSTLVFFGIGGRMGSWEFWGPALAGVLLVVGAAGLFFMLAVAALSPPASNRALGVRVYITALVVVTGAVATALHIVLADDWPFASWYVCAVMLAAMSLVGSACERDTPGARIQRTIPRWRLFRPMAFVLYSGASGGVLWSVLLAMAVFAAGWGNYAWVSTMRIMPVEDAVLHNMQGIWLYVAAYTFTAILIHRYLMPRFKSTMTAALAMLLMAIGTVGPMIVAFFIWPTSWHETERGWWLTSVVSPVVHSGRDFMSSIYLFVGLWLGMAAALAVPWWVRGVRQFTPTSYGAARLAGSVEEVAVTAPAASAVVVESSSTMAAGEGAADG